MDQQAMLTNKRKAQLIIIATFLFGTVVGASGYYLLFTRQIVNQPAAPSKGLDVMTEKIGLSPDQRKQIEQIIDESRRQRTEWVRAQPQSAIFKSQCRERIRAILTPPQQELYDKWNEEQDAKRDRELKPK
jgi:hypothetical protein